MGQLIIWWLDDYRDPFEMDHQWIKAFSPILNPQSQNIIWIKSYAEFKEHIVQCEDNIQLFPSAVCFDHDLCSEETGYDAAKLLIDYCDRHNCSLPKYSSQSANPAGRKNILGILSSYERSKRNT